MTCFAFINIKSHIVKMFCSHIFVAERHSDSNSIILCRPVFRKTIDIQMILQLCQCLSATNIRKHHTFSTCGFMIKQHNNHKDKVYVFKFKDLQVHKFTDYLYLYGRSLKKR